MRDVPELSFGTHRGCFSASKDGRGTGEVCLSKSRYITRTRVVGCIGSVQDSGSGERWRGRTSVRVLELRTAAPNVEASAARRGDLPAAGNR